jgi:predicted ABC-type ATPase
LEGIRDPYILRAVFLGGAGGSGKSLVSDAMFGGSGLKVINADKHLERFVKAAGIPLSKIGGEYGFFAAARDAMKMELRHYAQLRLGLIIDSTAWDYSRVARPAKKLRELGYDLFMVFVTTSLETALARNRERGKQGGRYVPDSFVEDAWRGAHRNLKRYAKLFGPKNMRIIDNDVRVEVDDWVAVIKPKLHSIGQRILNRPLKNPRGKKWLKMQQDPATRTLDKPGPREWPKPEPPPPLKPRKSKASKKRKPKASRKALQRDNPFGPPPAWLAGKIGEHAPLVEHVGDLPFRGHTFAAAIQAGMFKACEIGPVFVRSQADGFVVEAEMPDVGHYARVIPGEAVLFVREADGTCVPLKQFGFRGRHLVSGPPDALFPIPLEEKHWRDNPKDFRTRLKITPEKKRDDCDVCTIGKSAKNGKFYGWSHRAYSGFKRGDIFFPKLKWDPQGKGADWSTYDQDAWEKGRREKQPKIKTDGEARQSAVNFADWVS